MKTDKPVAYVQDRTNILKVASAASVAMMDYGIAHNCVREMRGQVAEMLDRIFDVDSQLEIISEYVTLSD